MTELYNKFRFRNGILVKKYGDAAVKSVFDEIYWFEEQFGLDAFIYSDLIFFAKTGVRERGHVILDLEEVAKPVIRFLLEELGNEELEIDVFKVVYDIVERIMPDYTGNSEKFTEPLAMAITEELSSGDRSLTMDEIALKLKGKQEFRFLPLPLLKEIMNSVYDYLINGEDE